LKQTTLKKPLTGIIPPMVTPLENQDKLDEKGLERLIEHLIEGGVHGLFMLGTTGEALSLSYRLRTELIELTCKLVKGRLPVLVGITDTSISESIQLAEKAVKYGADAVVAAPPFYYTASKGELEAYFKSLAEELPLPLLLYNMPSHTGINIEPVTTLNLAEEKNIIGLKDSSGDMIHFQKIVRMFEKRPDFTLLVGPEELLMQTVLAGGHGGVNGGANMFPRLYVEMYKAAQRRDFDRMHLLQGRILDISSKIYSIADSGTGVVKGLKCALSIMGICSDFIAKPLTQFKRDNRVKVKQLLEELNPADIL
jgi:4-hydroxy-tetrahydrodipicolinate synthase